MASAHKHQLAILQIQLGGLICSSLLPLHFPKKKKPRKGSDDLGVCAPFFSSNYRCKRWGILVLNFSGGEPLPVTNRCGVARTALPHRCQMRATARHNGILPRRAAWRIAPVPSIATISLDEVYTIT